MNNTDELVQRYGMKTVSELIVFLQAMPPDALVWHEGCDCWGAANGVELKNDDDGKGDYVLITRGN